MYFCYCTLVRLENIEGLTFDIDSLSSKTGIMLINICVWHSDLTFMMSSENTSFLKFEGSSVSGSKLDLVGTFIIL